MSSNGHRSTTVTSDADAVVEAAKTPLLELERIEFSYGHLQVLFGVDLSVDRGESVALLGTNGAGKSTLLGVVSGLLKPSVGRVVFEGEDITDATTQRRVELGMIQVRGGRATFPSLSVHENLKMGAYPFWNESELIGERLDGVLALFPQLESLLGREAGTLSGGQQQIMAIGRALMTDPKLLMIDELSLGLAPVILQDLVARLREISEGATTVIVVEQSLNVALSIARRAFFMERGTIRFEGATAELLERDDLARSVFFGSTGGASGAPAGSPPRGSKKTRSTSNSRRRARGKRG